ncbi:hypothetical protein VTK26DRAFT_7561 [Humicola hyalothermophila]
MLPEWSPAKHCEWPEGMLATEYDITPEDSIDSRPAFVIYKIRPRRKAAEKQPAKQSARIAAREAGGAKKVEKPPKAAEKAKPPRSTRNKKGSNEPITDVVIVDSSGASSPYEQVPEPAKLEQPLLGAPRIRYSEDDKDEQTANNAFSTESEESILRKLRAPVSTRPNLRSKDNDNNSNKSDNKVANVKNVYNSA